MDSVFEKESHSEFLKESHLEYDWVLMTALLKALPMVWLKEMASAMVWHSVFQTV